MAAAAQPRALTVARAWLALLPVRFDDRRFWLRAALAGVARALALALPWLALRTAISGAVMASLQQLGVAVARPGATLLQVGEQALSISTSCTHIEVFALIAPLLWDRRHSALRNGAALLGVLAAVLLLAVARIDAAVLLHAAGVPWALAHDVMLGAVYALMLGWTLRNNAWTRDAVPGA